jgi:hypothetical protein
MPNVRLRQRGLDQGLIAGSAAQESRVRAQVRRPNRAEMPSRVRFRLTSEEDSDPPDKASSIASNVTEQTI